MENARFHLDPSRDRFHQGPFISHHEHSPKQGIEQVVDAPQYVQMTIRQKDAAMFHGSMPPVQ